MREGLQRARSMIIQQQEVGQRKDQLQKIDKLLRQVEELRRPVEEDDAFQKTSKANL